MIEKARMKSYTLYSRSCSRFNFFKPISTSISMCHIIKFSQFCQPLMEPSGGKTRFISMDNSNCLLIAHYTFSTNGHVCKLNWYLLPWFNHRDRFIFKILLTRLELLSIHSLDVFYILGNLFTFFSFFLPLLKYTKYILSTSCIHSFVHPAEKYSENTFLVE